ncbi:MAG: glycosyltransferase family 4 protein, partial [Actinomycetota bacterium]
MGAYLLVLLVAGVTSYLVTPAVLGFARKRGAVDLPNPRKVHALPTPTLGGAAIFLGFLAAFAVASSLAPFRQFFRPLLIWPPSEAVAIVIGTTVIFIVGLIDDLRGLRPPVKLAGQVLAAGFVFLQGVRLEWFRLPPLGTLSLGASDSAILTIVWIVVIVNAVNLIDGLDGLATGITSIAAGTFFVYSYEISRSLAVTEQLEQTAPLISIVVMGAGLGFLRHNFNPARIFMGDSGSMALGFLLATATVVGVGRSSPDNLLSESVIFYLPVVIPLIILAIPILDTVLAVARRARRGNHIFQADKEHLHHRLLEIGHGHRQAVLILYAWTAVIAGLGLALSFAPHPLFAAPFL